MHLANLLEPWLLLRLVAGLVAVVLFTRAATTSLRVLRHFQIARATEGQLALERQAELAATFVRVATVIQVGVLALSMLAGDRLSTAIRGAMCGYGVFHATPWGFRSLAATATTALAAGIVAQLYALDARLRSFDLARPLAVATLILAPLAAVDFGLACAFALNLDLSVVASCCSVQLDAVAAGAAGPHGVADGLRSFSSVGAVLTVGLAIILGFWAARRPRPAVIVATGLATLIAIPFALATSVLEVAPHAMELPQHVCPFCLLRPSVFGLGYGLFGAILLASTWGIGTGLGALIARSEASQAALGEFARSRLKREALAWLVAGAIAIAPIVRYTVVSGGVSLFR